MALEKILMPDLGEGVTEGEIIKIKIKAGDKISLDDPLLEVMTDKASMEVPSILSGVVKEVQIKVGEIIPIGKTLLVIETEDNTASKSSSIPKETIQEVPQETVTKIKKPIKPDSFLVAPATRKLAQELGVDLKNVKPSGKEGQILRDDLMNYMKATPRTSPPQSSSSPSENLCSLEEGDTTEPLRGIKRIMAETMTVSKQTIPHFTVIEEACMDSLIELRSKLKPNLEKENIKLTYLPFIMKALLSNLKVSPIFNSQFDDAKKEIVYRKSHNLSFAIDTEEGLLVPVVKNAQTKSLLDITKEIQILSIKAREGKLEREELQGGTFTLTNLGSIGGLCGTPIIQPPQVALLGIYRFDTKCKKIGNEIKEKIYSQFSLTCDHRVIDGAKAARFLKDLVLKIENPESLLLD